MMHFVNITIISVGYLPGNKIIESKNRKKFRLYLSMYVQSQISYRERFELISITMTKIWWINTGKDGDLPKWVNNIYHTDGQLITGH